MKKTTISGEKINEQLELINSKKWPGWLPTFHNTTIYEIDLLKKSVELKSTNLTETSNNH